MTRTIPQTRDRLAACRRVRALTGAGVSAESGIPTFRGPDGLWRRYRPEDLATPEAFARDPRLVWEWYAWRRALVAKAAPNPGHFALARMEAAFPDFWLVTQNVDGLHRLAGSKRLTCLHGDIWTVRCTECGRSREDRAVPLASLPPKCPDCGGLLRPGVVWFGESLPDGAWAEAVAAAREADAFLVIGTAGAVQPAASLAGMAKEGGAYVVEINPAPSQGSPADTILQGKAGEILPQLL